MPDDVDVAVGGDPASSDAGADLGLPALPTPGSGRTPAEGEGEGDVDLEQIAEEFDASALESLSGKSRAKGEGKGDEGRQSLDSLDEFIEKNYQGDRNAFVHSLYASREEMKRMRERLDEIEAGRTTQPRSQPEPRDLETAFKESRTSDPEIQALDQEVKVIDDDMKAVAQGIYTLTTRAQQVAGSIKELNGRLAKAEVEERPMIRAEIAELNAELLNLDSKYEAAQDKLARFNSDKRRVQREIIRAERDLKSSMADEADAATEREQVIATTRDQFNSSITSHFSNLGIDSRSEQGQFLHELCRTKLRDYFLSQGDGYGLDGSQIHAAVGQILDRAVKVFSLKPPPRQPRSTATPRPVLTPRTPPQTPGSRPSSSPQSSLDGVLDNPNLSPKQKADFVRKRADALARAQSQRSVGRGPV